MTWHYTRHGMTARHTSTRHEKTLKTRTQNERTPQQLPAAHLLLSTHTCTCMALSAPIASAVRSVSCTQTHTQQECARQQSGCWFSAQQQQVFVTGAAHTWEMVPGPTPLPQRRHCTATTSKHAPAPAGLLCHCQPNNARGTLTPLRPSLTLTHLQLLLAKTARSSPLTRPNPLHPTDGPLSHLHLLWAQ